MRSLKILVVEDSPDAVADLKASLAIAEKKRGLKLELHFAETTADARRMVRNHCFHGISIDQNLAENIQGEVSHEVGQKFIGELGAWDPPCFMALFTAHPNPEVANFAGTQAKIPYIVKSTEDRKPDKDGHRRMTFASYATYFLAEVRNSYVQRVLKLVMESGFHDLHHLAHDTATSYGRFLESSFQNETAAKDFFFELGKFRENFNLALSSFAMGIASEKTITPYPNPNDKPSTIEGWLSKQWRALEKHASMPWIKSYFHLTGSQSVPDYYVKACATLRGLRNATTHENRIIAPEDFDKHLYDIFQFFDMVGWLMRAPLIAQPFKRENHLNYTELNSRQNVDKHTPFSGDVPELRPGSVFTLFGEGGMLLPLDKGFTAERDKRTNRLRLKQAISN